MNGRIRNRTRLARTDPALKQSNIVKAFWDASTGFAPGAGKKFYCRKARKYTDKQTCIQSHQSGNDLICAECATVEHWIRETREATS